MDRASSGKLILLCLKKNQTAWFDVQRLPDSGTIAIIRSEVNAITRSEVDAIFDRHPLGIYNRVHPGTMIFFSSEW
jgi:hypothetical protein